MKFLSSLPVWVFLLIATTLEVTGDAFIRKSLFEHQGAWRIGLFLSGMARSPVTAPSSIWRRWNSARWSVSTSPRYSWSDRW